MPVYTWEGGTSDTTPPFAESHTPTRTRNVSSKTNVTATFSEDMKDSIVNKDTVKLVKKGSTTRVEVTLSYDATARKVILDPKHMLRPGAPYKATVTTGVRDAVGNAMVSNASWSFKINSAHQGS